MYRSHVQTSLGRVLFFGIWSLIASCISDKKPAPIKKGTDQPINDPQQTGTGSIEDIIRSCGVDPKVYSDPNGVLFEQNFRGLQKKISGTKFIIVSYAVVIEPSLSIRVTNSATTQNTDIKLISATPAIAASQAEQEMASKRGVTTSNGLTQSELTDLKGKNSEWSTMLCTAKPFTTSTAPSGLKLKFEPALPASISPLAQPEVYARELGEGKDFTVKAIVEVAGTSGLTVGQQISGRVSIKKVNPNLNIIDQVSGQNRTIQGDLAYQVSTDFGGVEQTNKLGLSPQRFFYISHQQRRFVAIVAIQGDEKYDPVVFLPM